MTWEGHDLGSLICEMHYERVPRVDRQRLLAEVNVTLPSSDMLGEQSYPVTFAHYGYEANFADGKRVPVMSVVLRPSGEHLRDQSRIDLSQTWTFPAARETLDRCHDALSVVEMMGRPLQPPDRLRVFRTTVLALCAITEPVAAWWPTATQLLPPPTPSDPPLMGLLNVRLFRIEGTGGDIVMDTLGLHVFGLPDMQCHCRGLEAARLAALLHNAGIYIFEHGDVVEDGHTIEGLEPGQRWKCHHEKALVPPNRVVLDLNPGPAYAPSSRKQ